METRDVREGEGRIGARAQYRVAQRRRIRLFGGRDDPDVGPRAGLDLDRGQVDAVARGPGHHSHGDHWSIVLAETASCTAMRKRYIASSFARPKYTRFVRRTTVRSS